MSGLLFIWLGWLQLANSLAPPAAVAQTLIQRHCASCHDASSVIDLRTAPPMKDARTWRLIYEQVDSYRMPPPKRGSVAQRFPIDQKSRQQLLTAIEQLLDGPEELTGLRHMSYSVWVTVLRDFVGGALAADDLAFLSDYAWEDQSNSRLLPWQLLLVREGAAKLCARVADAEMPRETGARTVMRGLPRAELRSSTPATLPFVAPLFERVFGVRPLARDRRDAYALVAASRRAGASWSEAWQDLCTYYLSSPRLLYQSCVPER